MTDALTSMVLVFAATFGPLIVGSFLGVLLSGRVPKAIIAAAGLGILVWLFIDLMEDADVLDLAQGLEGGWTQVALVGGFVLALFILVEADRGFLSREALPFSVALLATVSLGLHSAGEAIEMGNGFATIGLNEMLGTPAVAFLLHKAVEGFMLSSFIIMGASPPSLKNATLMSFIIGVMATIAAPLGYYSILASTYVLAVASGANVYMMLRLAPQAFSADTRTKVVLAFCIGFLMIYFAALLHS